MRTSGNNHFFDKVSVTLAFMTFITQLAFVVTLTKGNDPGWSFLKEGVWFYAAVIWVAVGFWLAGMVVRQALRNLRHPQESAPKEPQTTSRKPYFGLDTIRRANDALMGGARRRGEPYEIYVGNGLGRVKIPRPTREEIAEAGRKALANHYKREDTKS